ncbi:hypothetical protein [Vibrio caribbeanicus]|uniref:Uncharacterized protein n=1 Tax=Vibrio caribbeanicus ATCC BAA-2122 TaxID=796620 RepID=E3BQ30_9VIBR|nr:hypothetical protein [Vibrio caribbeanicus]EFP94835.1 hypothetical protein VIBC2010_16844 [Vibrio caribbeanicus ATCC BAA-2122]
MNDIEYLNWLIVDTATNYPALKWFMGCITDSLNELNAEDILYCYANECTDWDILKYCAYQSEQLNIEHTTPFVKEIIKDTHRFRVLLACRDLI